MLEPDTPSVFRANWTKVMRLSFTIAFLFVGGVFCGWGGRGYFSQKLVQTWAWGTFMDANESFEDGLWESATIQLHETIHYYPPWYAPHLMLGKIFVEHGYYELAEMHLLLAEKKFENSLPDAFPSFAEDLEEIERLRDIVRMSDKQLETTGVTTGEL